MALAEVVARDHTDPVHGLAEIDAGRTDAGAHHPVALQAAFRAQKRKVVGHDQDEVPFLLGHLVERAVVVAVDEGGLLAVERLAEAEQAGRAIPPEIRGDLVLLQTGNFVVDLLLDAAESTGCGRQEVVVLGRFRLLELLLLSIGFAQLPHSVERTGFEIVVLFDPGGGSPMHDQQEIRRRDRRRGQVVLFLQIRREHAHHRLKRGAFQ
jgi:hypothetical protein